MDFRFMILKFYIYTSELLRHHHLIANGTILLSLWQLHHTKLHRQRIVNQQSSNKKLPPRIYLIVSVAYKDANFAAGWHSALIGYVFKNAAIARTSLRHDGHDLTAESCVTPA